MSGLVTIPESTNQTGFTITEVAQTIQIRDSNQRTIIIQNQDPVELVYISLGGTAVADNSSLIVGPGKSAILESIDITPLAISAICEAAKTAEINVTQSNFKFFG